MTGKRVIKNPVSHFFVDPSRQLLTGKRVIENPASHFFVGLSMYLSTIMRLKGKN